MNSMTYMLWMQISLGLWLCCTTGAFSKEVKSRRKVIDNLLKNPSKDAAGIDEVENDWINKKERIREIEDKRLQKKLESQENDVPDIWERIQNVFGGKYYVVAIIGIVAFLAVSCTLHALLIKLLIDKYRDSEDKNAKNKKKLTRQEKRQLSSIFPGGTTKKNKTQESTIPLLSHSLSMTRSPKQSSDRQARHMRPQGQKMPPKRVLSSPLSSSSPKKEMKHNQMRLYDDHITTPKKSKEYKINKNKNFSNVRSSYSLRETEINSDTSKKKNRSVNNIIFGVNTTEQAIPQHFQSQGQRHDSNTKTSKKSYQNSSCHRSSLRRLLPQNTNTISSDPLLHVTANEETGLRGKAFSPTPISTQRPIPFNAQSPK